MNNDTQPLFQVKEERRNRRKDCKKPTVAAGWLWPCCCLLITAMSITALVISIVVLTRHGPTPAPTLAPTLAPTPVPTPAILGGCCCTQIAKCFGQLVAEPQCSFSLFPLETSCTPNGVYLFLPNSTCVEGANCNSS